MFKNEAGLIQRAREGDPAAFAEIYDRYQPAVYRCILCRVGNAAEAEPPTTQVFGRLVEEIDRVGRQGRPLLAWLYSVARDLVDYVPQDVEPSSALSDEGETGGAIGPERGAEGGLTQQGLVAAIGSLPEDQRAVVLLKFVEGLDNRAVAQVLGKPVGVVRSLQREALPTLAAGVGWWDATRPPWSPQRQVEEQERLQAELIQNLTHELRTPLSLIQGYAELFLAGDLGPISGAQQNALTVIHERAAALAQLIRNLTALEAIPRDALSLAPVSVRGVVDRAMGKYRHLAAQVRVQFEVDLPDDLPPVLGDREHLELAFSQLLDNAIKFSPDGGRIQIRGWVDGRWVYVAVRDEGIGLAPEHLDRVFERFYQVDGSTTRRFGGVGLGLTIVRAIVEAHSGRAWASSEGPGRGSTFTLALSTRPAGCPSPLWDPSRVRRWRERLNQALDESLVLMEESGATLEECLARYPEYAEDLRVLLEVALGVRRVPRLVSSPAAFAAGKRRMLQALEEKKRRSAVAPHPLRRIVEQIAALFAWGERPAPQRRVPAFQLVTTAALVLLLIVVGGLSLASQNGGTVTQVAVLSRVGGVVEILPTDSDTWRLAEAGEVIEAGDRVRTGLDSAATLLFFDGSTTDLEANTKVTLVQMLSRRDGGGRAIVLHQWLGRTYTQVEHLPDAASRFEIETPTAVTAARGTEFAVAVEEDGTTSVVVIEGLVDVTAQETTISVEAGRATTVRPTQPPARVQLVSVPSPTPWSVPLRLPFPLDTARPAHTPVPTETPFSTRTPTPTGTPVPSPVPTQRRATPRPSPTWTPAPTETPTPSPTP
ncbi:MAG TPA: hypothetical protein EYH30_07035, partial [Anaerolineales bacterium]|nr:hypothetical protein [Anaerolineales bacterium]